jgi:hypothetical protein
MLAIRMSRVASACWSSASSSPIAPCTPARLAFICRPIMPTFSQVNEPGDERRPDDFARHGTPLFSEPQMLDAQNKQRLCVLVPPLSGELTGGSVRYKVALNARFPVVTRIPREGPLKQRCTGPSRSRAECLRSWPMRSPRTSNTKRAYRPTATTADFGSFARNRAVHSRPVVSVSRPYSPLVDPAIRDFVGLSENSWDLNWRSTDPLGAEHQISRWDSRRESEAR